MRCVRAVWGSAAPPPPSEHDCTRPCATAHTRARAQAAAALQLVGQACEARYGKNLPAQLWDALQKANGELAGEYL